MDEMNISSQFTTGIVSKLISKALKKKGYDVDIKLNNLKVKYVEGKATIHVDADANMDSDKLKTLLDEIM